MANESTTTSHNDLRYAPWIAERVLEEARPNNLSWPLFRSEGPHAAVSLTFPIYDDPGAAAGFTEGTDNSNTAGYTTSTSSNATAGTVGHMATVTDELMAAAIVDAVAGEVGRLGRSVAEKIEVDHAALYGGFSNVTGSTGTDFTVIQFVSAQSALITREISGDIYCVLHPQQVLDLQAGSGNTPGGLLTALASMSPYFGNPNLSESLLKDLSRNQALAGFLFGIPVFQTTAVPTANTGADRAGGMFVQDALGRYEVWGPRVEMQRDASLPGTEIVATARYGVVEIRDAWGQSIITDA